MIRTFIAGIILGIVAAGAALYYFPAVDQFREQSMIVVQPNASNTEIFHVNVPIDRIMIGAPAQKEPLPAGLQWPEEEGLAGARAELFKIRNGKDTVVGVASRIAASDGDTGDIIEWVLHLPARGSVYLTLQPEAAESGYRTGEMTTGTREFEPLHGGVIERWVADTLNDEDDQAGRIELTTAFVAREFATE
jgi:hypothetical protein